MLKKKYNVMNIELTLEAISPLLVQDVEDDSSKKNDKNNKIHFLTTGNKVKQGEPYIPGSTLKGIFRNKAENIMRIFQEDSGEMLCCNPLEDNEKVNDLSCSKRIDKLKNKEEKEKNITPYNESCPICKIFGNQHTKSRIHFSDAFLTKESKDNLPNELPTRTGAPINRFVGNNNNLFSYEYILGEKFVLNIKIENFELWELGLLAFIFRDLFNGEIHIGFGSSRGLGKVEGIIQEIDIKYYNPNIKDKIQKQKFTLWGLGFFEESGQYDFYQTKKINANIDFEVNQKNNLLNNIFPTITIKNKAEKYQESNIWYLLAELSKAFNVEEVNHA